MRMPASSPNENPRSAMAVWYRRSLGLGAAILICWAFLRVGWREILRVVDPEGGRIELVLMHWSGGGGQEEGSGAPSVFHCASSARLAEASASGLLPPHPMSSGRA